jgi:hypothetical protein
MAILTLASRGQTFHVDSEPLPLTVRTNVRYRIARDDEQQFILAPPRSLVVVGTCQIVWGLPLLLVGLLALREGLVAGLLVLGGAGLLAMGVWLRGQRHVFSRTEASWRAAWTGRSTVRPLSDVLGVVLTRGGWSGCSRQIRPTGTARARNVFVYQLQLVLRDAASPAPVRLCLYMFENPREMWTIAERLGRFLNVPALLAPEVQRTLEREPAGAQPTAG